MPAELLNERRVAAEAVGQEPHDLRGVLALRRVVGRFHPRRLAGCGEPNVHGSERPGEAISNDVQQHLLAIAIGVGADPLAEKDLSGGNSVPLGPVRIHGNRQRLDFGLLGKRLKKRDHGSLLSAWQRGNFR
jgi:hypothetical protein